MDAERWKEIDKLLDAALDVSHELRYNFVSTHAGADHDLRDRVLELLKAEGAAGAFLDDSAMQAAAKKIADDATVLADFAFINKTIATYHIERLLGAGGMGEVYLAHDSKLNRKVALKLLPAEFVSNDERVKRFEAEARAVAKLNHPGIVTVYDVGNFEGINYIATEFVEGKTLRELMGERFKIRNIILNSIQICDAIAAAHSQGIIHRDIKPENIMIRKDGYAKVLDFGLAKLTDAGPQTFRDLAKTSKGVIIGTPAYMSPAQVTDDQIDHRTDLWSCGVVLYEFLTCKNPFKGADRQETFRAILSKRPEPCSSLNPEVPEELDRIVGKLLEKDPALGYQSAADLRSDLKRAIREVDSSPSDSVQPSGIMSDFFKFSARGIAFGILFFLLAGSLLFAAYKFYFAVPAASAADWTKAKRIQLTFQAGTEAYPSISPDGGSFIYASGTNDNLDIFLLRMGGTNAINLTADSDASDTMPAFSPDGSQIAFRSEREPAGIYVMGATGENPRRISEFGYSPSWSPDGSKIVVSTSYQDFPSVKSPSALWVIDVVSGNKKLWTESVALQPSWSPDGNRIAFWYTENRGKRIVATIAAAGGEPVDLASDSNTNWNPVWSPDGKFLYYASDKNGSMAFWRAPIDPFTGRAVGDHEIVPTPAKFNRHLSFSRDGKKMIYVETENRSNIKVVPFDPVTATSTGPAEWITRGDFELVSPEISPANKSFVVRIIRKTQEDIVSVSIDGKEIRDLTNDPAFDRYARISPDGGQIAFSSDRSGIYEIWLMNADGTNLRQVTSLKEGPASFPLWSPDGRKLTFDTAKQLYLVDLSKPFEEAALEAIPYGERGFFRAWDWSPDGKKLAGFYEAAAGSGIGYYSFETRKFERFTDFNSIPRWLPDSRRLIFERNGRPTILDTETGKLSEILPEIADRFRNIGVSRDGKLLYYTTLESESNIWMLDLS